MLIAAAALLALIGYTYAGYPLLIAALARVFRRRVQRDVEWKPTVSVLCSVYNGAEYVDAKIDTLVALDYPAEKLELLFYDDGSTDDSSTLIARRFASRERSIVVSSPERKGKPTALATLAKQASGDVLLLTDIRQRLSSNALSELVAALADPEVGCAGGLLKLEGDSGAGAYWKYERWIRRSESSFRSVVGVSGSLYAIRKRDFPELASDTILDDLYVPMRVRLAGARVVLVPNALAFDTAADDGREFARKVRTLAGNYQLFARMPALLSPLHNPSWLETVSHKLLRLVCPWALIALLIISALAAADSAPMLALLATQLLAYTSALLGRFAGPIGKLARTFVVMNTAAVVGLWRYATGRQQITW